MANFLRLICAVLVTAFSLSAHALIPKVTSWAVDTGNGVTNYFPTKGQACTDAYRVRGVSFTNGGWQNVTTADVGGAYCLLDGTSGTSHINLQMLYRGGDAVCPVNSTVSGTSCVCTPPKVEDATHTSCVAPPTAPEKWKAWCAAAINESIGDQMVPGRSVGGGCLGDIDIVGSPVETPGYNAGDVPAGGGCSFYFDGTTASMQNDAKAYETHGTGVLTGGTCMKGNAPIPADAPPDTTQDPPGSPDPCPNGYAGTLNGSSVCANRDPTSGIEGVKGTEVKNADGSTTAIKETTKCNGGVCTTTKETTQRDSSGNIVGVPKVEETKQPIGDKCNQDPGNKVCSTVGMGDGEGGAGMTGNCASGFVVKGEDPILNAMALEQYKRNCEVLGTANDDSAWVIAERDRTTDRTIGNPNNSSVTLGPGDIDTSDALGHGAQCIADKTIMVAGSSVLLPFSKVCGSLELLGNVLLGVTLLAAAGIVIRG